MTPNENAPLPPPPIGTFVTWQDALSPAELDGIEKLGDALSAQAAQITVPGNDYDGVRVARVAWIDRTAETEALYLRIEGIVLAVNARYFRYDLSALMKFQYTVYDGSERGHFDWHHDYSVDAAHAAWGPRKLTFSIQLSDGASYEGCDLQTRAGNEVFTAPRMRGAVVGFPSFTAHRVTPITAGIRKALVVWATGPDLR